MKNVIVYCSNHHGNTKKLLDAIAALGDTELIDATQTADADLSEYDTIGFASGIYFSKYHKSILEFAKRNLPSGKSVFFIHTGGDPRENQNTAIKAIAETKDCKVLGTYYCKGYDTFGPFKLIGGINKSHPDQKDIAEAVAFYKSILQAFMA